MREMGWTLITALSTAELPGCMHTGKKMWHISSMAYPYWILLHPLWCFRHTPNPTEPEVNSWSVPTAPSVYPNSLLSSTSCFGVSQLLPIWQQVKCRPCRCLQEKWQSTCNSPTYNCSSRLYGAGVGEGHPFELTVLFNPPDAIATAKMRKN